MKRLPLWLILLAGAAVQTAQAGPLKAADLDWRPRYELTPEMQAALPSFCDGAYVPPRLPQSSGYADPSQEPIHASADRAQFIPDQFVELMGDVEIRQGDVAIKSDRAFYDQRTGHVDIDGAIQTRGSDYVLVGEQGDYDVESGRLDLGPSSFVIYGVDMRGEAASISRPAENKVRIRSGVMTTCEPGDSDWSMAAAKIDLNRETGVGVARHVRFQIGDVPVLYVPYVSFPIDDRRKSGFLYPTAGTSNTGRGMSLSTPYYFNLAPNYDLTVTPNYINGRGLLSELDGRYLNPLGLSEASFGYIENDEQYGADNPTLDSTRWGFSFDNSSTLGAGWKARTNINAISDDDYLRDLNQSVAIDEESHLDKEFELTYRGGPWQFSALAHSYQTIDKTITESEKPYSRLPELTLDGYWDYRNGMFLDWGSQYSNFYRDNAELSGVDEANGSRLHLTPEVGVRWENDWAFAQPSVLLDQTNYLLTDYTVGDEKISRTVPFLQWDNGIFLDRDTAYFDVPYRQSLEPRLYYVYSPEVDQADIPDFDTTLRSFAFSSLFDRDRFTGGDRVGDNNRLTAALTTRFVEDATGIEKARFSIGQIYYFEDRQIELEGLGASDRTDSPLAGEAVLMPIQTLDLSVSGLWDPREQETVEGRSQMSFHTKDYRYLLNLGHTYRNDEEAEEQSDISAVMPLGRRFSVLGRWFYDLVDERTAGTVAGIEYTTCCWSVQFVSYSRLTDESQLDHQLLLQFALKGLGRGGSQATLGDAIYGYEAREERRYVK